MAGEQCPPGLLFSGYYGTDHCCCTRVLLVLDDAVAGELDDAVAVDVAEDAVDVVDALVAAVVGDDMVVVDVE